MTIREYIFIKTHLEGTKGSSPPKKTPFFLPKIVKKRRENVRNLAENCPNTENRRFWSDAEDISFAIEHNFILFSFLQRSEFIQ